MSHLEIGLTNSIHSHMYVKKDKLGFIKLEFGVRMIIKASNF